MPLTHEKRAALPEAALLPTERYGHRPSVNPVEINNTRSEGESWGWALVLSFQLASLSALVGDRGV